jgi:hypothetical protein
VFLQEHFEAFLSRLDSLRHQASEHPVLQRAQSGDLAFTERSCRNTSSIGNVAAMAAVARAKCIAENIPCRLQLLQGDAWCTEVVFLQEHSTRFAHNSFICTTNLIAFEMRSALCCRVALLLLTI